MLEESFLCTPIGQFVGTLPAHLRKVSFLTKHRRAPAVVANDKHMLVVQSGIVAEIRAHHRSREILSLRFPGETIVPRRALGPVLALVSSSVVLVAHHEEAADAPSFLHKYLFNMAHREASILQEWIASRGLRDATSRVAHLLCEIAFRSGERAPSSDFRIPLTQAQIADITGMTAVHVNRCVGDLQSEGMVERQHSIIVRDLPRLANRGQFDPAYLQLAA